MNTSYQYTTTARWTAGRTGAVKAESAGLPILFSTPPEFRGQPGFWTPEHFLVAALAGCFVATFAGIAVGSKFDFVSIEASATGLLEKVEGGLQFTRVTIRPVLAIAGESDRERALRLLEKAERSCLVARSLRAEMALEPTILIQAPVPVI